MVTAVVDDEVEEGLTRGPTRDGADFIQDADPVLAHSLVSLVEKDAVGGSQVVREHRVLDLDGVDRCVRKVLEPGGGKSGRRCGPGEGLGGPGGNAWVQGVGRTKSEPKGRRESRPRGP